MKIKLSKSQWEGIGKKAGWKKESGNISLGSNLSQLETSLKNMGAQDFIDIISSFVGPTLVNKIVERLKEEGANPKRQISEPDFKYPSPVN